MLGPSLGSLIVYFLGIQSFPNSFTLFAMTLTFIGLILIMIGTEENKKMENNLKEIEEKLIV